MKNSQFNRCCYKNTGGWLPMLPLTQSIKLGDFCQLRYGVLRPLGNIEQLRILEKTLLSPPMMLDPLNWQFNSGVQPISLLQRNGWTEQVLSFSKQESCLFYLDQPKAQYILNWHEIKDEITIKLTQSLHAFREVCVVTEVVNGSDWAAAIADSENAELKLVAEFNSNRNCLYHVIKHASVRADLTQYIELFEKHTEQPCYFYKAKKLVIKEAKKEQIKTDLIKQALESSSVNQVEYWTNCKQSDLIAQVPAQDITINNCLDYFDWADVTLEDAERLCQNG